MMMESSTIAPETNSAPGAPMDAKQAEELCARVLQSTAELISLLDRETMCLRNGDMGEINAITSKKSSLGAAMLKDMAILNANASTISSVVPETIEMVKDQHARFERSLRVNHEALGAVKAISENLMRTISNAAGAGGSGPETYGGNAVMTGHGDARPAAMSINRSL
jgi:hypothetical protein